MSDLGKIFRHLARDLYIYFLSGFFIACNLIYLDNKFNSENGLFYLRDFEYWIVIAFFICYILGQINFSMAYIIFERSGFEEWMKKKLFKKSSATTAFKIDVNKEVKVFKERYAVHEQFVERHTELYLLRWNMAGAMLICSLLNFSFGLYFGFSKDLAMMACLQFLLIFPVYILSLATEEECMTRIEKAHDQL